MVFAAQDVHLLVRIQNRVNKRNNDAIMLPGYWRLVFENLSKLYAVANLVLLASYFTPR